jgi:hypothetical protein
MKRAPICLFVALVAALISPLAAQSTGPDVIVGDLYGPATWATVGNFTSYSLGTVSCNIGTQDLSWIAGTNQHPVIGQGIFRLKNGRFEQIATSWLKHGFTALQQSLCATCSPSSQGGAALGIGCSDPYSASLNGSQNNLGARSEVNAATGFFPYPPVLNPPVQNLIDRRLKVSNADVDPTLNAGALYFGEGQYVTADDAASGNKNNNASYRPVAFTGPAFTMATIGPTVRELPAIYAWAAADPGVTISVVDIPNDGRMIFAAKATPTAGGSYHFEFALHNLSSDRCAGSLTATFAAGGAVSNIGFHDIDHHSGEVYSTTDWTASQGGGAVTWSTQSFANNANANALRWGTMFSYWCDAPSYPSSIQIGLFKPGTPSTISVIPFTLLALSLPLPAPTVIPEQTPATITFQSTNYSATPDPATATLFVSTNGGPFVATPAAQTQTDIFQAALPAAPAFTRYDWYVSVVPIGQTAPITLPANAPASFFTTDVGTQIFADDFETNQGWTVTNTASLTTGAWERGSPVGGGDRGDPGNAQGGTGQCFVTGNTDGDFDVDLGSTTLTSPVFNVSFMAGVRARFWMWHSNNHPIGVANQATDSLRIEVTADGVNWVLVENYATNAGAWVYRSVDVGAYVPLTPYFQIRFTSNDLLAHSTVESGIDTVSLLARPDPIGLFDPSAAGNIGVLFGGPFDSFFINNSAGAQLRKVAVGLSQPITFTMGQPLTTPFPASFVVFGMLGLATSADVASLGVVGSMSFPPCPMQPGNGFLFTLADSFGVSSCAPAVGGSQTPWVYTYAPGLPFPVVATLQGLVVDTSSPYNVAITNAVALEVRP